MISTTPMTQLFAVVLGKDRERVTEALLREGVMQFVSTLDVDLEEPDKLSPVESDVSLSDLSDLRKRVEGVLYTIGVVPRPPQEADLRDRASVNLEREGNRLDKLDAERQAVRERQRGIQQEILKLEDIKRQVSVYGLGLSGVKLDARHSVLAVQTGQLPASNVRRLDEGLHTMPALHMELGREGDRTHHLLISMKRDREQIAEILSSVGWSDIELSGEVLSAEADLLDELSGRLETLNTEQKTLQETVNELVKKEETHLRELWISLRVAELCSQIQTHFKSSSRTAVFAGWLPSSKKRRLVERLTEASEGRCYLEWHEADSAEIAGEEVPVQFDNPKVLAPFQMLVCNFGVPKYGTIDPTPFVMPMYLIMFGLMFADVGQGLVLAALGALGVRSLRNNEAKKGLFHLSWLVVWCGVSAVVFGALLGSYFGMPLIKPLWFDFHGIVAGHGSGNSLISNIYDVLAITIYFGISVIFLGLVFNWINIIRAKRWMELIFDKGGLLGGWMYGGGIYIASYMIKHQYKEFPSGGILMLLAGLPAILLFIKEPYHYYKHEHGRSDRKPNPAMVILDFLMKWIVELLEIFSGYLSNTLSFMRVAGLGIAHACLMISFFTLADMTSGVFSLLILVLGNVLVIGLEGLSAGIQALRLNYYEFFTKFFHGTGKLHTPISLSSQL